MFIATAEFVDAANAQARALGFPDVARVFTPHPVQDRTDGELRAYAEHAYTAVVAALTA